MSDQTISEIKNFREQLFFAFKYRADATMELIDSIAGNINATSITELSLSPNFRHRYSSISDAITNFEINDKQQIEQTLIKCCKPITSSRPYHLFALDCTPAPRKYARTLKDRSVVHAPNPTPGNKPITVGHQYSIFGYLPEKSLKPNEPCWFLPLSTKSVVSDEKGINSYDNVANKLNFIKVIPKTILRADPKTFFTYPVTHLYKCSWLVSYINKALTVKE